MALRNRAVKLTDSKFSRLLRRQNIGCDICHAQFLKSRDIKVDHDHISGKSRGLLCHNCNVGLGHFQDDPSLLEAAADYLKKRTPEREKPKQSQPQFYSRKDLRGMLYDENLDMMMAFLEFPFPDMTIETEQVWSAKIIWQWWSVRRRAKISLRYSA